uniref:Uncharacterized protein n=1 Tax=Arundo donax TaxID=35708 RepID=A0A0A8YEP7_ARUDO
MLKLSVHLLLLFLCTDQLRLQHSVILLYFPVLI